MKKITLLLLAVLFTASLNAQKIGVKGGVNFSSITTNSVGTYSYMPGFNGGVFFQKGLIPLISIRPGISLQQKGYKGEVLNIKYSEAINYIQFDLPLRVKAPLIPIYAVAGPYAAYAVSGTSTVGGLSSKMNFGNGSNPAFDYGLQAGVGYQQNLLIGKLFIEFTYMYGMYDVDGSSSIKTTNKTFAVDAGIVIGL